MSGMLLVLLSGLAMFGVISIDDGTTEPDTDELPAEPEGEGEGGSNPLDEATNDEESAAASTDDTSDDAAAEGSGSTGEETDTSTNEPDTGGSATDETSENDTISGSEAADTIDGGAGDDLISGGLGADSISGGEGNDVLYGGAATGGDDGAEDTLSGGAGDDRIFLEDTDVAIGGEGADTFVRSATMTTRTLINDFDATEDVVVVEHESDTPPTLDTQEIVSDGVILRFSDGTRIELAGLTEAIDETLISFVDIRG